jgi:DNA-binding MarR family transcriptional regulator
MTPEGKRALAKLRALAAELEDDFLSPLAEEERAQLHVLLLRLAEQHMPQCPRKPAAA